MAPMTFIEQPSVLASANPEPLFQPELLMDRVIHLTQRPIDSMANSIKQTISTHYSDAPPIKNLFHCIFICRFARTFVTTVDVTKSSPRIMVEAQSTSNIWPKK
jgi:hypothetical protein